MNKNIYLKLRLERQHFTKPAGKKEYGVLFKQMSPVLCVYWSCPGSPPELLYRAAFDDRKYCYKMRGSRSVHALNGDAVIWFLQHSDVVY